MMFFFSQGIQSILRKQNISTYIESIILTRKGLRHILSAPKLVQVVTSDSVSDGVFDYPCIFTSEKYKKGSYLRVVRWEVNTRTCELAIHEAQYLGGAGCEVQHGRKWDNQRLKNLASSRIISKHYVVLHEPIYGVTDRSLEVFSKSAVKRAIEQRARRRQKQIAQKLQKKKAQLQQKLKEQLQQKMKAQLQQKMKAQLQAQLQQEMIPQ